MGPEFSTQKPETKLIQRKMPVDEMDIIKDVKSGVIKKIVMLTGPEVSLASSFPDIHSFSKQCVDLISGDIPYPEAFLTKTYYSKSPQILNDLVRRILGHSYNPNAVHKFIKDMEDKKLLVKNYTACIDNLQIKAGSSPSLIIQFNGNIEDGYCDECKKNVLTESYLGAIKNGEELKCTECKNVVRPRITLLGEAYSKELANCAKNIRNSDLLIIIGASSLPIPISNMISYATEATPRLFIGESMPELKRMNKRDGDIFLTGDILSIIKDLSIKLDEIPK